MIGVFSFLRMILILVVVALIAGGLWYITNLKADLAVSEINNKKLVDSIAQQQAVIDQMKKDIQSIQKANSELTEQNERQRQDVDNLARKFDKRDFGAFVSGNPDKAEKIINKGTVSVMRCLELASGAPLNETEKSAKTPVEANRACPSLINPAYTSIN